MISILIPVYNYNIKMLIENLLSQFEDIDCKWEILISDDASKEEIKKNNSDFIKNLNLRSIKLFQQEENIGNASNRNVLIQRASFNWLLFLDADVLPVSTNFLTNYIKHMQSATQDIIAGSIKYDDQNPLPHLLRWKYGMQKEQVPFIERKNNKVLHARGANFAIKRELAQKVNFPVLKENYGFVDTCFFLQFNKDQFDVIENPVFHLGLEPNIIFLQKTKKAIVNALFLLNSGNGLYKRISIISTYQKMRVLKGVFAKIYLWFHKLLESKLLSKKPSILIFQLYKLLYISYLDANKDRL